MRLLALVWVLYIILQILIVVLIVRETYERKINEASYGIIQKERQ